MPKPISLSPSEEVCCDTENVCRDCYQNNGRATEIFSNFLTGIEFFMMWAPNHTTNHRGSAFPILHTLKWIFVEYLVQDRKLSAT